MAIETILVIYMNTFKNSSKISKTGGFIQNLHSGHRYTYGTECLFHLTFEEIGTCRVQHVAEPVVYLWKKYGLISCAGILKSDKFHRLALVCTNRLPGDKPSDGRHLSTDPGVER